MAELLPKLKQEKQMILKTLIMWIHIERLAEKKGAEYVRLVGPGVLKMQYPLYKELHYELYDFACPLCYLYNSHNSNHTCFMCPLRDFKNTKWGCCEDYSNFCEIGQAKYAGNIVNTLWKEYKRLGG